MLPSCAAQLTICVGALTSSHITWPPALLCTHPLQINAKISKTTHMKEMNFEIEKLKQMLIATREKNGGRGGVG